MNTKSSHAAIELAIKENDVEADALSALNNDIEYWHHFTNKIMAKVEAIEVAKEARQALQSQAYWPQISKINTLAKTRD